MALTNFVILQIIYIIILCICINANSTEKQSSELKEQKIANLTASGMDEPELFYNLTQIDNFDNRNCTNLKEKMTILYKYKKSKRNNNFAGYFPDELNDSFNEYQNGSIPSLLRFEDFFAIQHYTNRGYQRINKNTAEGRRMKNAFYRLAIIQSRYENNYNTKLFKGFGKSTMWFKEQFNNKTIKEFQFNGFNSTSPDENTAKRYAIERAGSYQQNMTAAIFEMNFSKPFLSANIDNITIYSYDKEIILLPNTKFKFVDAIWKNDDSGINLKIKLTYSNENMELFEQQKKVMRKFKKLRESGTQFYVDC
ncbi:uncharacterized protein LOC127291556 isoform X1 [Leptopilina boulardi]|uniref:uncharacterized protein LOC127291556 isoform X1 n=1 Tax=Leptopilina boulardi TaxID=63433 RepID=UPI0021F56097|nr:uncharacterized protein LOC127291556 isoform X1 [Leptopilina boulardi]